MVLNSMAYECKIYDKNGKLVKVVSGNKIDSKADKYYLTSRQQKRLFLLLTNLKTLKKSHLIKQDSMISNAWCVKKNFTPGILIQNIVLMNVRRSCN